MGKDKKEKNNKDAHENFTNKVKEFKEIDEALEKDGDVDTSNIIDEISESEHEQKKLVDELNEAKKQSADYLDKLRRNMAEFDNFRKRTNKEKSLMYDDGVRDTMEKLIPVLDNFELALNAVTNKEDNFYKGVDMILKQLQTAMSDAGVEEISALGTTFDPNIHNAVAHVSDEAFGENEVIEEMRKGYKFKDKILRYSMVKVAN